MILSYLLLLSAPPELTEVKIGIDEQHLEEVESVFGLNDHHKEKRAIFFFDTMDLKFFGDRAILRVRAKSGAAGDSIIKLRPVDPKRIGRRWSEHPGFKLERDQSGLRILESASLSQDVKVDADELRPQHFFSTDQIQFLYDLTGMQPDWSKVHVLGPVESRRWKRSAGPGQGREVEIELWKLPNLQKIIEVSFRVPNEGAASEQRDWLNWLTEQGLEVDLQGAKTETALRYFSSQPPFDIPAWCKKFLSEVRK